MSDSPHRIVRRGFISVGSRQVHVRWVGKGPPALFIHSSPTNSIFVLPDMLEFADDYSCFAFDTPGFGLSDPLPLKTMTVADLAQATADAMDALGLPPLPVFGTHSGAAIALELGFRHAGKITGLVLDGVPIFTQAEVDRLGDAYFAPLVADVLGGHFAATWTRFHDQSIWFPWFSRHPDDINESDLSTPEGLHRWCEMFFAAAGHYSPAYRAATSYCDDAIVAARGLAVPAVFTTLSADMLYTHLQRLPRLREDQTVVDVGNSHDRKREVIRAGFARFGSPGKTPRVATGIGKTAKIVRQFVDDEGRSLMFRYLGDPGNPAVVLLHDVPGSGLRHQARMMELAHDHFVLAPDIPGSGESEGLPPSAELADYAAAIWRLCEMVGISDAAIEGVGLGSSLAIAMAAAQPERSTALTLAGLVLPAADERAAMIAQFAPAITIERDGAHWYRLWLRLRDSLVYAPWFDTRRAALRRTEANFDAWDLHYWTVEVMKQHATAHHFAMAAMRFDAAAVVESLSGPIASRSDPLASTGPVHDARLVDLLRRKAKTSYERNTA